MNDIIGIVFGFLGGYALGHIHRLRLFNDKYKDDWNVILKKHFKNSNMMSSETYEHFKGSIRGGETNGKKD